VRTLLAPRASAILYGLLRSRGDSRPWLLPANICPVVPLVFAKAGVPIELVDISPRDLHLELDQALERLTSGRFGGVLYAHTYGEPSTPRDFFAQAKQSRPDVMLVDDRCLCAPELDPDSSTFADVVLYSTGYAKQVDLGHGGYAFVQPSVAYTTIPLAYDAASYAALEQGYKSALSQRRPFEYRDSDWLETQGWQTSWREYRAQIAAGLAAARQQRARLQQVYAELLPAEIQLPAAYQEWRFNVRVTKQQELLQAIFAAGDFASAHYASLAGVMGPGVCPNAELLAGEVLNLFVDRYFTVERAERVARTILANLG
jgi:dTDP-4-amino-4,6-dideoxygalactose transaminase